MIKRKSRMAAAAIISLFAASGHAATATVSPALAACSKALIESISKAETLPAYTVKPASALAGAGAVYDPNSFTVRAHGKKTGELLGKASCKATPDGQIISFKSLLRS